MLFLLHAQHLHGVMVVSPYGFLLRKAFQYEICRRPLSKKLTVLLLTRSCSAVAHDSQGLYEELVFGLGSFPLLYLAIRGFQMIKRRHGPTSRTYHATALN